jgi:hypothetical protein
MVAKIMSWYIGTYGVPIGKREHYLKNFVEGSVFKNRAMDGIVYNGSTEKRH